MKIIVTSRGHADCLTGMFVDIQFTTDGDEDLSFEIETRGNLTSLEVSKLTILRVSRTYITHSSKVKINLFHITKIILW